MKTLIAIPAYNEEQNINKVIESVRAIGNEFEIVVINDGSTDNTEGVCNACNCPVLTLPVNLGLSGAFGCAMKYAYLNGYDAIIQIDGDGQHDPNYIGNLAEYMKNTGSDVVIGSRFCNKKPPLSTLRGIGSRLISMLIYLKTHSQIYDPTSGMRMYNRRVIELFVKNAFLEPEPHTMAYLSKHGYTIKETPVIMQERIAGESYLQGIKVVRYMSRVCMSILLV